MSEPAPTALDVVDNRAAAVATHPRITKQFIEDNITDILYCTGDEIADLADVNASAPFAHLTLCIIRAKNGFMVVGESAPMSPENFNAALGQSLAYEDAFRKLWPLYAFAHLEDMHLYEDEPPNPHNDGEAPAPSTNTPEGRV